MDRAKGFEEEVLRDSAGLLEICDADKGMSSRSSFCQNTQRTGPLPSLLRKEVKLIHRSAHEFLHEEGRHMLDLDALGGTTAAQRFGALLQLGFLCLDNTPFARLTWQSNADRPFNASYHVHFTHREVP